MEGVTFNFVASVKKRPRVLKVHGIENDTEKVKEKDLLEFSAPSRGVAKGERLDVVGTPRTAEDMLKGLVGTPGERRRVLSQKDLNET
jgi:hypothetical protein